MENKVLLIVEDDPINILVAEKLLEKHFNIYKAKNAKMDSLAEIFMINEWRDNFYEAFSKYITVYGDGKINVKMAATIMLPLP